MKQAFHAQDWPIEVLGITTLESLLRRSSLTNNSRTIMVSKMSNFWTSIQIMAWIPDIYKCIPYTIRRLDHCPCKTCITNQSYLIIFQGSWFHLLNSGLPHRYLCGRHVLVIIQVLLPTVHYSGNLNNEQIRYMNGPNLSDQWLVC